VKISLVGLTDLRPAGGMSLDIFGPESPVEVSYCNKRLWVYIEGRCILRVRGIEKGLVITDELGDSKTVSTF
jgi:hypothetical protein